MTTTNLLPISNELVKRKAQELLLGRSKINKRQIHLLILGKKPLELLLGKSNINGNQKPLILVKFI